MLISRTNRFIFIHIYKNAGTSISSALLPYAVTPFQRNVNRLSKKVGFEVFDPHPYPAHIHAAELLKIMGKEDFDSYFSFAIVRNPWDWQVSLYTFALKTPTHHQHEFFKGLGSFNAYLEWRCTNEVRFQKDFIYSDVGERLIDFIGRYERLEQDFQVICSRIGISASLPHIHVSKEKPYREYYAPDTIELVRRTFAPDIEAFGYEF